jgi:hypothetical protein
MWHNQQTSYAKQILERSPSFLVCFIVGVVGNRRFVFVLFYLTMKYEISKFQHNNEEMKLNETHYLLV